jgi:two-component system sensor histidine kinase ComP
LIVLKNKFNSVGTTNEPGKIIEIDKSFTEVIEEVRSISRSLVPPELRRLGLKKAIIKMLNEVEKSTELVVTTDLDILENMTIDLPKEIRIYRIIQELTNNTLKHSQASSLKVAIEQQGSIMVLTYQDNGVGFDPDKKNENSLGLRSINQRIRYLNGSIKYEKPPRGMKVIIKFKSS